MYGGTRWARLYGRERNPKVNSPNHSLVITEYVIT